MCWTGQKQTSQLADMCGSVTYHDLVPWHGVGDPVANRLPSGTTPHCQQAVRGEAYQNCRQQNAPSTAACPEPCGGLPCHRTAFERPQWAAWHAGDTSTPEMDPQSNFACKAADSRQSHFWVYPLLRRMSLESLVCNQGSCSIEIVIDSDADMNGEALTTCIWI